MSQVLAQMGRYAYWHPLYDGIADIDVFCDDVARCSWDGVVDFERCAVDDSGGGTG